MKEHKVNPVLSNTINILFSKILYPTIEYGKENLTDKSYIFAPNHTNNLDGYLIWSLLNNKYDCSTFMYKEFWDNYPVLAKFMPIFNVFPISRDKVVLSQIKTELKKLKKDSHSLIIFPQGRHVNPEVMIHFYSEHIKTIPLGAFYFSTISSKPIIPIFMEPQLKFKRNIIVYGNPIYPKYGEKNSINTNNLEFMAAEWLKEINRLYALAQNLEGRKMHPYKLREHYFDASGMHSDLKDPNSIIDYLYEINKIKALNKQTSINNINELGKKLEIDSQKINKIIEIKDIYDKHLVKR